MTPAGCLAHEWLVVAAVYAGLLLATAVLGAICWDLYAVNCNPPKRTFSRETQLLASRWVWTAVVLTGMLAFAIGALVGHLYLAQALQP